MRQFIKTPSISLKDLRLLPGYTTFNTEDVCLKTKLCKTGEDFFLLHLPLISAAMHAVTGTDMAITLGTLGGVGVLPLEGSIEEQCRKIRKVKRFRAGFQTSIITFAPTQKIEQVKDTIEKTSFTIFPVTDNGLFHGKLMGIITDKDFDARYDLEKNIKDRMRTDVKPGIAVDNLKEANQLMIEYGYGFLPIVTKEGTLESVVFKKDLDRHIEFPNSTLDENKRIRIGAAISTYPDEKDRVSELVQNGVDFLVIDSSDGYTVFQKEMIQWIKLNFSVPVICGNVITAEGFKMLAEAGADAVKIGMGIGSGCITQEVKSTGRGQATAILEVAKARDKFAKSRYYVPLIADGSICSSAEIIIALSLGADSVMMGNFFARFDESPGEMFRLKGQTVKEYWMEGSYRAKNFRRYYQKTNKFFEEGISGFVPYHGSLYDYMPLLEQQIKSAFAVCGALNMESLHQKSVLELQSVTSLHDSGVHHMIQSENSEKMFSI